MTIVTGGAGFIGSCIVRMLNDRGIGDILVVDHIASTDKWMNLSGKEYIEYVSRDEFPARLEKLSGRVERVIHMGACSATTERDFDFLYRNNFGYTKLLWKFCAQEGIPFIYASSAATYGDGSEGFDDRDDIRRLRPLNAYGYSKQLFDLWAQDELAAGRPAPSQHVGFKFFNVYGPNEYFKGSMASVVMHTFNDVTATGEKGLFRSYRPEYPDGGQLRDFIYVKDICKAVSFMIDHPEVSGLFNLGTGRARSFLDLATATFRAMGREPNIKFIDMPEAIRDKYQYYTQASMEKLRAAGYTEQFYTLEEGVADYVTEYLAKGRRCW